MKSKHITRACILMLLFFSNGLFSQNNTFKIIADATENTFTFAPTIVESLETTSDELFGITDEFRDSYALEPHDPDSAYKLTATMIALGAGLGFGNDQFIWCLHAAYYLRLATMGNSLFYGSLGLGVSGLSNDFFTRTLLEPTLKFLMFSPITQFSQVHFIYGLALAYALGSEKLDSGGKYDITRLTAAFVVGFAIILSTQLTLMLQTNLIAHTRQTVEPDVGGIKTKTNNTWGTINQNNIVFFSLLFRL